MPLLAPLTQAPLTTADAIKEAKRHFRILGNGHIELRGLNDFMSQFGDWSEIDNLARAAVEASESGLHSGIHLTLNEIAEEAFLKYTSEDTGQCTKNGDISRLTTFFVDIDPERTGEATGQDCATDEEIAAAQEVLHNVLELTTLHGFPEPLKVFTGNGFQLFWRINLPNDPTHLKILKNVLQAIAAHVDTEAAKIDQAVFNPGRLARVAGTVNRKNASENRSQRQARIISAPDDDVLKELFIGQLVELAEEVGAACLSADPEDAASELCSEPELSPEAISTIVEEIVAYLQEHGQVAPKSIRKRHNATFIDLPYCLFKGPGHTDGGLCIIVWNNGNIVAKCFHDKCALNNWYTLQDRLGVPFVSHILGDLSDRWHDPVKRTHDDPLVLARYHVDRNRTPEGDLTTTFFHGRLRQYSPTHGWSITTDNEIGPWVRATIQHQNDEFARLMTKVEGKLKKPRPVVKQNTTNVLHALHSICKRDVPEDAVPPFWLEQYEDWNPDDLLVFQNGIVNIQKWLLHEESFIPLTAKLYHEQQTQFDFDSSVVECPEWQAFLASLDQDFDWYDLLQEIMGYCLWLDHDLQKIFMFVGSKRGGKGTIVRVLEQLLGGDSAVCGLELEDFAKQFGLEKTLGKRLGTFGDIDMPEKHRTQIVAKLKSVSGGDLVPVPRKNKKELSYRLRIKLIMLTNSFLALPDNSGALQARMIPLRFTKSFVGKEDITLEKRLIAEYPAILNWSLIGLRRLHENNGVFTMPESSSSLVQQISDSSSPLLSFVEECCILDGLKAVREDSLYSCYERWMKSSRPDEPKLSPKEFEAQFTIAAPSAVRKRQTRENATSQSGSVIQDTEFDTKPMPKRPFLCLGVGINSDLPF